MPARGDNPLAVDTSRDHPRRWRAPARRLDAGVQARLRSEHQRKYPDLNASVWYDVAPIFPGVTQRMVNMAGERLTRLSTPRGFMILRADHLEFRPVPKESPHAEAGSV